MGCVFLCYFIWRLIIIYEFQQKVTCIAILTRNNSLIISSKSALIEGDILLGGLFPVHQKGRGDHACGMININRGVQRVEAMLYSIDKINKDETILPNITLGAEVFDTCARSTYALEQSLEFIRGSFSTLGGSDFECDDGSAAKPITTPKIVAGVIGGSYSSVSIQVANLLRLFKMPQISYASTSSSLSDKSRYDFFVRTVPPDNFQAKAMADILQFYNWTYVSSVASEGDYGQYGIESFLDEARRRNICVPLTLKIPSRSDSLTFDTKIKELNKKENAKVVILFLRVEDAKNLLEAARRKGLYDRFTWIASDGWGIQSAPVRGNEIVAEGALTIELQSATLPDFVDYFLSLKPSVNSRNPWFEEYWENVFDCKFPSDAKPLLIDRYTNTKLCTGNESLSLSSFKQETKVQFIYDAVQVIARALDRLQKDLCPNTTSLCEAMKKIDGERFLKSYILNMSFHDGYGGHVKFDEKGDAYGRYTIMNYQRNNHTGLYGYVVVGNWTSSLELNTDKIIWSGGTKTIPKSHCSQPCTFDEYKFVGEVDTCCWVCIKCQDWQYLEDEFTCKDCGPGRWPHSDKKSCYSLPAKYMRWNTIYALIPMGLAFVGLFLTSVVILTFVKHNDTPIVMASGRELSYMLLGGCLSCYMMTFLLLAKPTVIMCAVQRFGVGFGFSVIYSSLLTKTNRISRIFNSARRSAKRPAFISPKSQIIITGILISIQVLFTIIWLVLEIPGTRLYFPYGKRNEVILKCRTDDISFLVSLIYNMLLIIICTLYAIKTRKIPENFNESKFIGFAMYTTCIVWLAFVPIYFGTLNSFEIQITTLCVSISLSATVALFCLFTPKMYIIVFQPEKNVRRLTMNSASYKKGVSQTSSVLNSFNHNDHASERIKLNVNYDQKLGVTTTTTGTDGEIDSLTSL